LAHAIKVPLYQLLYDGEQPPKLPNLLRSKTADDIAFRSKGEEASFLGRFRRLVLRAKEPDKRLLLYMAQKMANR
jgi:hypothetical protein